ncbi:MAG: hypothetical protein OJF51_000691 [Nitrospira sp.]|nr:MAG: hypothetical protein OJF51_000691 [Nitrospira sp.]
MVSAFEELVRFHGRFETDPCAMSITGCAPVDHPKIRSSLGIS